jgi:intracellular sulfur oxidation DsrE/DsrF family protein
MKSILSIIGIFLISVLAIHAQTTQPPTKIVFQMSSPDTLVHKSLMKQLNNILSVAPQTKIKVVCHGPGIYVLVPDHSIATQAIERLRLKGVEFIACEFSIEERKISSDKMLQGISYTKAGILEVARLQDEQWRYIKSGF